MLHKVSGTSLPTSARGTTVADVTPSAKEGLPEDIGRTIAWALNQRAEHGRHLHHSACIHNLAPERQV